MGFLKQSVQNHRVDPELVLAEAKRIADIISETTAPAKILLFGSAVDGRFKVHSDIDLLLIYTNQEEIKEARSLLARRRISPKWPCDYLFMTEERFETAKNMGGPAFAAHSEGVELYAKRPTV